MAQFDFPRINFFGGALINPPTANNNILLPLVLFDPIKIKALLPPRIYLTGELKQKYLLGVLPVPESTTLQTEEDNQCYIEVDTVNTAGIFKDWATTPLGHSTHDEAFHELYAIVLTERDKRPLKGLTPAGWNYYGGMEFEFDNVTVCSVEIADYEKRTIHSSLNENYDDDLAQFMNASVDLKYDNGKSAAVMVDVTPSLALYTQVFCDSIRILKGNKQLLKGMPGKASLRFLNTGRIVNLDAVTAASGTFFCTIPIDDTSGRETSELLRFFTKHHRRHDSIKGIFVRYNLFEVKENSAPVYTIGGKLYNPARCSVLGSFTPWYQNEMTSITMGRQMIATAPFYGNKTLAPFVCHIDENRKVINLDLIGTIPETTAEINKENIYETHDLGALHLKLSLLNGLEKDIGTFTIDQQNLHRNTFINCGGILEVPFTKNRESIDQLKNGALLLYGLSKTGITDQGSYTLLMSESEYMVATDEAGIYLNQHDDPANGYYSYDNHKVLCKINVYHKGKPYDKELQMTIKELRIKSSASSAAVTTFMETGSFKAETELLFPTNEATNVMYALYPGNSYNGSLFLIPDMLRTGFFISLRILPAHDYGKYIDPRHPEYPVKISFEVLYNELLAVFDLIYPASSLITPFNEAYFIKAWKFIKQRLSPELWHSSLYMPSSRDMAADQWQLICKWAEGL